MFPVPSNLSPKLNSVVDVNAVAVPEIFPVKNPVTFAVTVFATTSSAYILLQRTVSDPKLYVFGVFGSTFSKALVPVTFNPVPMRKDLATLAPPAVEILPVVKLVASSTPVTKTLPSVLIFPATSSLSLGLVL